MSRPETPMARLVAVGTALRDVALVRLRAAAQECRRLEAEIAALDARARLAEADGDIAARAVAGEIRARLHAQQRAALNAALARARVEEAAQLRLASRAFGREQALNGLLYRAQDR
ncbi:MAG: hypothetical protein JXJ18_05950 [Rhodobacteraceae bacterium]|nr:hypothetical protein [Paracoccaceae bacterium]